MLIAPNTFLTGILASGIACRVYCLDGGAWDRPTEWGSFATLEEAKDYCLPVQAG